MENYLGSVPIPPKAIGAHRFERPVKDPSTPQFKKVLENEKSKLVPPPNSVKSAEKTMKALSKTPIPPSPPQSETPKENGTDLAAMKVAREFEKQYNGIMQNHAFDTVDEEGGMAVEFFRKELVNEWAGADGPGYIAKLIYEELQKKQKEVK